MRLKMKLGSLSEITEIVDNQKPQAYLNFNQPQYLCTLQVWLDLNTSLIIYFHGLDHSDTPALNGEFTIRGDLGMDRNGPGKAQQERPSDSQIKPSMS